ncbi:MAG: cytochrome c oxidase subunit I, partial [Phycisphaerales bacterium]|nr:cytochrome c oxidase subunit I [Phycisphaerales bacterium]
MTTTTIHPDLSQPAPHHHAPGDNYLTHGKGILSWLLTLDHKRIALMYLVGVLGAYALGGFFALMLAAPNYST